MISTILSFFIEHRDTIVIIFLFMIVVAQSIQRLLYSRVIRGLNEDLQSLDSKYTAERNLILDEAILLYTDFKEEVNKSVVSLKVPKSDKLPRLIKLEELYKTTIRKAK